MKIRALKSFFGEGKQTRRGDVLDVDEQRGRMLITRRLATEIDGLAVPKETDKAPFVGRQLGGQTGGEKQQSSSPAVPAPVTSISKSGEGRAKFLCINEGYRLAPFADALYACDRKWWETSRAAGAFTGLKISHDGHVSPRDWNVQQVKIVRKADALQFKKYAVIGDGGNSGFQAINLAVQFWCEANCACRLRHASRSRNSLARQTPAWTE